MDQKNVTEIVEFKFNPDLSDEECIKIVDFLEKKFHSQQKGFINSELAKGKDGRWIIIQHWETKDDLRSASKRMMKEQLTEDFRHSIDPKSVKMKIFEQARVWN